MKPQYVTVERNDPAFASYLWGYRPANYVAVPIAVGADDRSTAASVTFIIKERQTRSFLQYLLAHFWLGRPQLLGLSLGPAIMALSSGLAVGAISDLSTSRLELALCLLCVLLWHLGTFAYNDTSDFRRGFDTLTAGASGSGILSRGILKAYEAWRFAVSTFLLGCLVGAYLLYQRPWPTFFVAVCGLAGLVFYSRVRAGFSRWGFNDFLLWALAGPILAMGVQLTAFNEVFVSSLWLSCILGHLSVLAFQFKNFHKSFYLEKAGRMSFISSLGFDYAKRFLIFQLFAHWLSLVVLFVNWQSSLFMWVVLMGALGAGGIAVSLIRTQSPLGSDIRRLHVMTLLWQMCLVVIFSVGPWLS